MVLSAAAYLKARREAAGLSIEEVALRLDSEPPVSHLTRVQLLTDVEAGVTRVDETLIKALRFSFAFDPNIVGHLLLIEKGLPVAAPQLCRVCACSDRDPCDDHGDGCAWLEDDLCTVCAGPEDPDQGDGGEALPVPVNDVLAHASGVAA